MHHPVSLDIRVHDRLDTGVSKITRQVYGKYGTGLSPAIGRDKSRLGINAYDNVPRKPLTGFTNKFRVLDRGCSNNDVAHTGIEVVFNGRAIAYAATDLDRQAGKRTGNRPDRVSILGLACKRTIEVNHVQPTRRRFCPTLRRGDWIIRKHRAVFHIALPQANALPIFQVDCRYN